MAKQPTKPKGRLVFAAFLNSMKRAGYSPASVEEMLRAGPLPESELIGTGIEVKLSLPLQPSEDTDEGYFTPQGFKPRAQAELDEQIAAFKASGKTITKLGYADRVFIEAEARRKKLERQEARSAAKGLSLVDLDLEI